MLRKVLFSILFISSLTYSTESDSFLLKIRNNLNGIKPFKVNFINRVISNSTVDIEEKGVMTFRDSEKIKWEYLEPDHKIWILSGNSYEYYDKQDEQITRGKLEKKTRLWIFQILYEKDLSEHININVKSREIDFVNREEGVDFKVFFTPDLLPFKVIQKDPTGVDIVYIFSDYKSNLRLPSDEFELKTEGDVDIIEFE